MLSSDNISFSVNAPADPKTIKRKALLCIKARQQDDDDVDPDNKFPTGIDNEVVFMEITGKLLKNLYDQCQVSPTLKFFLSVRQQVILLNGHSANLNSSPNPNLVLAVHFRDSRKLKLSQFDQFLSFNVI